MVDEAALAYMRRHNLAGPVIDRLASHPQRSFPDRQAWAAHLEALGVAALEVTPDPVKIATQGAMWGAIRQHGLLGDTVVVSDDAGQFRVGTHALCWVHAERLVHKLLPVTEAQRRAVDLVRQLIWWFYRDLKAWQCQPDRRRAASCAHASSGSSGAVPAMCVIQGGCSPGSEARECGLRGRHSLGEPE